MKKIKKVLALLGEGVEPKLKFLFVLKQYPTIDGLSKTKHFNLLLEAIGAWGRKLGDFCNFF